MWGMGNIITRRFGSVNLVALVVWGGLIPPLPFLLLSWWLEGPQRMADALSNIGLSSVLALAFLAYAATMLGYTLWSTLLSRHPAGKVAPFSLLVPVVGLSSSAWLLGERLSAMQGWGALLVMLGLLINVFGPRISQRLRPASAQ
ncbi:putative amino-acid metabolite efflux pump [compost metagenome]